MSLKNTETKPQVYSATDEKSQEPIFDLFPEMGGVLPSHNDSGHRVRKVNASDTDHTNHKEDA